MDKLKDLARAKRSAGFAYKNAFDAFWETVKVLPDKRFFEIIALYVREITEYRFTLGRTDGVETAAKELFRKALCKEKGYSMDELIRFAKTYEEIKRRLYTPLFELVKGKGDDSYGDLIDNLPLLGHKMFKSLEDKDFGNPSVVRGQVTIASGLALGLSDGQAMKFIWEGENYNGMSLRDAAEEYLYLHLIED